MKPSERYAYARLARELSRPRTWLDEDPPTWEWPPSWSRAQARGWTKNMLFALRYGSARNAGKPLAPLLRRMGD